MNFHMTSEKILWVFQRASAVLNLVIIIYIFFSLNASNLLDFSLTQIWLEKNFNKFILFILFFSLGLHASLGISVIIHDYIHENKIKNIILLGKNLFIILFWGFVGISLYFI
tara:strand:+ start:720 stop:1055 length:336 start_codon:yes stop_codon:yes gene_type:complete